MAAAGAAALSFLPSRRFAAALAAGIDKNSILNDPDAPVSGNPKGDVTIVAFTDYNCPFCKKAEPDLDRLVKEDGEIRLVHKDWPILTEASVYGAQLALAAKYQGRYDTVHDALMAIPGPRIPEARMLAAVEASDVDMVRLQRDLQKHGQDIAALLRRNAAQADALGLQGTPTYLIGTFMFSTLDYDGFRQAVSDVRQQTAAK